jgi:hypothetical protein
MDVTGLVNLQSAVRKLQSRHIRVILGGVAGQPRQVLAKAGWYTDPSLNIASSYEEAVDLARLSGASGGGAQNLTKSL